MIQKLFIATCADDSLKEYSDFTLPIIRFYAHKWNAEFRILDKPKIDEKYGLWCYRTLIFYKLFELYDRAVYIDADCIINKNCPNPFEVVPYDTVGAVMEDKGTRRPERLDIIRRVKAHLGEIDWTEGFFNMGFYVVSKCHRDIFQRVNGKLWEDRCWDSPFYTYQIMRLGFKHKDLGFRFNHMSMFSESWNGSPSRFDSYIIHYAGQANFPGKKGRTRERLICNDAIQIYGEEFFKNT